MTGAMAEMGYTCTKITPPATSASCDCKGNDTVLVTFRPDNTMANPMDDGYHYNNEDSSNDFHAFHLKSRGVGGAADQWQVQAGDAAKGSPQDNNRTFPGMPENDPSFIPGSSMYCCCKCSGGGGGGKK